MQEHYRMYHYHHMQTLYYYHYSHYNITTCIPWLVYHKVPDAVLDAVLDAVPQHYAVPLGIWGITCSPTLHHHIHFKYHLQFHTTPSHATPGAAPGQ